MLTTYGNCEEHRIAAIDLAALVFAAVGLDVYKSKSAGLCLVVWSR